MDADGSIGIKPKGEKGKQQNEDRCVPFFIYCLRVESDIYFFLSESGAVGFNAAQGKNKCTLKP